MDNFHEMYKKFQIDESAKEQFEIMADSEFSKEHRVAKVAVDTIVCDEGSQEIKNKEVINAKLV